MNCPTCDTLLSEGSTYCSKCGAPIHGLLDRDAETDLAAANLERVRGNHPEAEAICVRVLRRDPNNVHAHSLLGDVYRDQKRFEEARQWYRMALDIHGASASDRFKLEQMDREIARTSSPATGAPGSSAAVLDSRVLGTQNLLGLPPQWWVRCWLVVGAVFIVLTVVFLVARRQQRPAGAFSETGTIVPGRSPAGGVTGLPSPAPRGGAALPRASSGSQLPSGLPAPAESLGQVQPNVTDRQIEQRILESGLDAGVEVVAVSTAVPDRPMVILSLPGEERQMGVDERKQAIVRNAFRAAMGALAALPNAGRVVVSVRRAGAGAEEGEPLFGAQMDRATAMRIPAGFPEEQFATALEDIAWSRSASEPPSNTPGEAPPGAAGE
jgi:hypothetical protein